MTSILIIEDDDDKFEEIESIAEACLQDGQCQIERSKDRSSALKKIFDSEYDLIIVDLQIPDFLDGLAHDQTDILLDAVLNSDKNGRSDIVIVTGFPETIAGNRDRIAAAGINAIEYCADTEDWKHALRSTLTRLNEKIRFDFMIVSALAKERDAYEHTTAELGEFISLNGLDCRYTSMGSLKGVNILLPRMGLVEASIATAKAIETFSPKCIVMGGICGGIESVADIGTLVVADPIWEYQTGKWHENGFQHDIYQEVMNSALTTEIKTFIARDPNLSKLKAGLTIDKKLLGANAIVAPMATGSAVVADSDKLTAINAQHRKMAAIDMEMYGVHRASSAARSGPLVFGAKVVVDTANSAKGDHYHEFGCALSARFCVSMLEKLAEIDMLPS